MPSRPASSALSFCSSVNLDISSFMRDGDDRHVGLGIVHGFDHTCIDLRSTLFPSSQLVKTPALYWGERSDSFFFFFSFLEVEIKPKISLLLRKYSITEPCH